MKQRLRTLGLILMILVFGFGVIVAATEYEARANDVGSRLWTTGDVSRALRVEGFIIDETRTVRHAFLGVQGTQFSAGLSSIDVYVYPSVPARVADEQLVQQQIMSLQALATDGDSPFRITSARNVLLMYHAESSGIAVMIQEAARSLSMDVDH